jgi:hypothetical protein
MSPEELELNLRQFSGSEKFYTHWLSSQFTYTEGVKYLAKNANCYWLLDAIASHWITNKNVRRDPMTFWYLTKDAEGAGSLFEEKHDSNGPTWVIQKIEFTDFPLPKILLYLGEAENGTVRLMLPGEY